MIHVRSILRHTDTVARFVIATARRWGVRLVWATAALFLKPIDR